MPKTTNPIIIFDTDCVLCSAAVGFLLRHERDHELHFAGAWSQEGRALAGRHGLSRAELDQTFLVIAGGRALTRSDAALEVARHLKAPWRWLRMLRIVPRALRDAAYGLVARRRYRWFGRRDDCMVVPPGHRARFIGLPYS